MTAAAPPGASEPLLPQQTIARAPARPDLAAPPMGTLSPPVPLTAVAEVLRAYPAAVVGSVEAVTPVAEGLLNRGYRLTTSTGRYFLKCYVDQATAARPTVETQHRATLALRGLGLPVAAPVEARDGRTALPHGGRLFALYPWTEGCHRHGTELDLPQCAELGALLGRLHGALTVVCAPVAQPAGVLSADPEETARLVGLLRRQAREHHPYGPFDALADQRLRERLDLLDRYRHRRPGPEAAPPTGWTHGDFHGLNLLYFGGQVAAVLDWDKLAPHPTAEEAVRSATLLFNDRTTGVLDLPRVRAYTRAYRTAAGARSAQLAAAAHRVWWERLNDLWMLQWRYQRHDHRADPLFPAAAAQLTWWCQEYEQVLDAFGN